MPKIYALFFCCTVYLFTFINGQTAFALDPNKSISQYAHRVWEVKDGLPVNTVKNVVQSTDGYLWFITDEGVVRFDGKKFVTFNKQNFPPLKTNLIYSIAALSDGSVWFGTNGQGAVRWQNGKADLFTVDSGLAGNEVSAIYEAKDGSLWFGTEKSGLSHFKNGVFTNFSNDELQQAIVWTFAETRDGSLWIGTNRSPLRYKDGQFRIYNKSEGVKLPSSSALCIDKKGRLWIGGEQNLHSWENETFTNYNDRLGITDETVMAVYEDRDENLWVGTSNKGLIRLGDEQTSTFQKKDGLSSDIILSFYEDREGSLWIGTESGGLNQLYDGAVTAITTKEGLADNSVAGLIETQQGQMWFATNNGLSRLDKGKITNFTVKDGLTDDYVGVLGETRDGSLWISPDAGGLDRFFNGKFQRFDSQDGVPEQHIIVIYEDSQENLWLATVAGLLRWRGQEKKTFTVKDGLADDFVRVLLEAKDGGLWIGTIGGLQRFDGNGFTTYTPENPSLDKTIRALHEDADGTLWIATNGGLWRMKKNRQIDAFNIQNGLFSESIHAILSDDSGNLWMSSNTGIFRVSKNEIEGFVRGEIEKFESVVYNAADGMKTREANGGVGISPAGWRSRNGRLWFASEGGAVVIDPNNLHENRIAPNVLVEEILLDEKSVKLTDKLNVPAGTNRLDFHFTAPSFRAPERLKFQYQLVGYDKDWHVADNDKRQISYTNLPPGDYLFRVKAANENGVWNEAGANLALYVAPRFYQTWWFYVLCALCIVGLGFLLYRFRLRQIKQKFALVLAERTRIAREIHDTLAQGFVGTMLQLEAAETAFEFAPDTAKEHLVHAKTLSKSSLTEARRSIWELRQENHQDFNLLLELEKFAAQATAKTDIAAKTMITGTPRKLPELIEHNLFRIGQEAITNAVKHSEAKTIFCELNFQQNEVLLRVSDDGKGFDQGKVNGNRFGLKGTNERAKIIGADVKVETNIGAGTKVEVTVRANGR